MLLVSKKKLVKKEIENTVEKWRNGNDADAVGVTGQILNFKEC